MKTTSCTLYRVCNWCLKRINLLIYRSLRLWKNLSKSSQENLPPIGMISLILGNVLNRHEAAVRRFLLLIEFWNLMNDDGYYSCVCGSKCNYKGKKRLLNTFDLLNIAFCWNFKNGMVHLWWPCITLLKCLLLLLTELYTVFQTQSLLWCTGENHIEDSSTYSKFILLAT